MIDHFKMALKQTLENEGYYSNDPVDPGGETYKGISRIFWPNWEGWEAVDDGRNPSTETIELFYWENFWNRMQGDAIACYSEVVTDRMFDIAVNMGVNRAVSYLQRSLNLLNVSASLYPDLLIDGVAGKITIGYLALFFQRKPPTSVEKEIMLINVLKTLQGKHYIDQMTRYPKRERFRGWFARL